MKTLPAEALGTSATWIQSVKALHKAGKPMEPKSRANKRKSLAEREGDLLRAQVAAKPGSTLQDLKRDLGLDTTIPNLWLALKQPKISPKKTLHATERGGAAGPVGADDGPAAEPVRPGDGDDVAGVGGRSGPGLEA